MRLSIHIDAGYLYGALATRLTGSSNRAAIKVDEAGLIRHLVRLATADAGADLLRVLWYDAAKDGKPDHHQRRIGMIDSVKLRMGRINPYGEQKGVDLRLGLDLVSMGVKRAVGTAYVVTGDDDLTEAVIDAQDLGLQVKLICVPADTGRMLSVAANLSLEADGILVIPDDVIAETVTRVVSATPVPAPQQAPPPEAEAAPKPGPRPSPLPPLRPAAPKPVVPAAPPTSVPVYSSVTGSAGSVLNGYTEPVTIDHDLIAEVARSVFTVWRTSAEAAEIEALVLAQPNIPQAVDRILLTDLVTRSGVDDIPTWARYELRSQFWASLNRTRASRPG